MPSVTLNDIKAVFIDPMPCEYRQRAAEASKCEAASIRFDTEPGKYMPDPVSKGGTLETLIKHT